MHIFENKFSCEGSFSFCNHRSHLPACNENQKKNVQLYGAIQKKNVMGLNEFFSFVVE